MIRAIDIEWDTDGEENEDLATVIEIPEDVICGIEDEDELVDAVGDYLSDATGWCHFGFVLENLSE